MPSSTLSATVDAQFIRWNAGVERTLTDTKAERLKQLEKWGRRRYDLPFWLTVLTEEVGEAAQEVIALKVHADKRDETLPYVYTATFIELKEKLRAELIQVAAVALAAVQQLDSGEA